MEEFGGMSEGYESGDLGVSESGESAGESREQAIARIEKQAKKAKQVGGQIQAKKKENNKLAQFLIMLLKTLNNDKIIVHLHKVFFSHDTGGPIKNVNHHVIVGLFAPFYPAEVEQFGLKSLYAELIDDMASLSLHDYIIYLKKLSYTYHNKIALNQHHLLQLIIYIMTHFHVIALEELTDDHKKQLLVSIMQDLFGINHGIDIKKIIL